MRLLILGTGNMASSHASHFAAIQGVELVGGVDVDETRLGLFCDGHNIPNRFASVEDAIRWGEFDAAANVTPDAVHHPTTMSLLAAGKHVFCEKPLATDHDKAFEMTEAADRVVAGEVTRAVRASSCDVGPIAEGDWLGIGADDGILAVQPELPGAATALLDRLVSEDHEIVTIIEGEGASAGATRQITEWLAEHRPDASAEVHHGGQPLYPYLFGAE